MLVITLATTFTTGVNQNMSLCNTLQLFLILCSFLLFSLWVSSEFSGFLTERDDSKLFLVVLRQTKVPTSVCIPTSRSAFIG